MSGVVRTLSVLVAVTLCLASASSSGTARVQNAQQAHGDQIREWGLSKLITSFCDGSQEPSDPSTHRVQVHSNGVSVQQPCGMVVVEILSDEAITTFLKKVCGGTNSPECAQQHQDMFLARLEERYAFANWGLVLNKCKAYPIECKRWMNIEFWATESHNEGVLEWARTAFAQSNEYYQAQYEQAYAEERERRQEIGVAAQAFAAAFAPKPSINCTTNTFGSTSTTTCQ